MTTLLGDELDKLFRETLDTYKEARVKTALQSHLISALAEQTKLKEQIINLKDKEITLLKKKLYCNCSPEDRSVHLENKSDGYYCDTCQKPIDPDFGLEYDPNISSEIL